MGGNSPAFRPSSPFRGIGRALPFNKHCNGLGMPPAGLPEQRFPAPVYAPVFRRGVTSEGMAAADKAILERV